MKIVVAYEHIRRLPGLHDEFVASIAEQLARRGHEVTVLCDSVADESLFPSVRFVYRREFHKGDSHRLFLLRHWAKQTIKEIEHDVSISFHPAIPADIVIPIDGWVQSRLAREYRAHQNAVWNLCLHLWPPVLERKIIEAAARRDAHIKCFAGLSRSMCESMVERFSSIAPRSSLITGASPTQPDSDPAARKEMRREMRDLLEIRESDVVFLWASNRHTWHGVRFLIEAFSRVCAGYQHKKRAVKNPAKLILAAEGHWLLHDRATQCGCADEVIVVGRTNRMAHLLEACDVVINPAIHSVLGRMTWEALAFGKPVIATEMSGGVDRLRYGTDRRVAGRIIPPFDALALQRAIEELLDDDARRLAQEAAEAISGAMHFEKFVERIEQFLDDVQHDRLPDPFAANASERTSNVAQIDRAQPSMSKPASAEHHRQSVAPIPDSISASSVDDQGQSATSRHNGSLVADSRTSESASATSSEAQQ